MNKPIIYITESKEISHSAVHLLNDAGYEVIRDVSEQNYHLVSGLFVRTYTLVNKNFLEKFPNLKFVLRAGVGLDNIDLAECKKRDIQVFNSPGANSDAVAEYVLAMSLFVLRGIGPQIAQVETEQWRSSKYEGNSLSSQTFGLIGCGHAGQSLSGKLSSLGVKCLGYDPYVNRDILGQKNIIKVELPELLESADIVVVMLPLTTETHQIMSAKNLAQMKPSSILINVSRGELVDEDSLINHVNSGHIKTAILDVVVGEPIVSPHLLSTKGIIITPHIAGYTKEANENIAIQVVQNFLSSYQNQSKINN